MDYTEEAKKRRSTMLAVDKISGVYVSEIPSDAKVVLYDEGFFNAIGPTFDEHEDETIYGIVDDETLEQIESEYGIR